MPNKKKRRHDRREPVEIEDIPPLEKIAELAVGVPDATMRSALDELDAPREENPQPPALHQMLAGMRNTITQAREDTAKTIADLESWRAEIDATIAFLRSK